MTSSVSGAWWPRSAGSVTEDSTENTNTQRDNEIQSPSQEPRGYLSFMTWSAGSDYAAHDQRQEGNAPAVNPTQNEEPLTWWSTIMGSTNSASSHNSGGERQDLSKSSSSKSAKSTQNTQTEQDESTIQRGWFSWQLFSNPEDTNSESDTEDKRDLEAFREAKSLVESCKDTCHYAVFKKHATNDSFLAVYGTSTENSPVKFNEKKQPIMPHQHFEKAISNVQNGKPVDTVNGDQSKVSRMSSVSGNQPSSLPKVESQPKRTTDSSIQNSGMGLKDQNSVAEPLIKSNSSHDEVYPLSPNIDSNLRVITLSTKVRLWSEVIIHKEKSSERHLYRSTHNSVERKRKKLTKKALVVSVHSFLPTKFVRSYISRNSGNACEMAENAVQAVNRWAAKGGIHELDVKSIAFEGIGTIESRKMRSIQLLKNWEADLKSSDFVFFVANSTSSLVAVQILQSILCDPNLELSQKKVGFLSMSGAFHGPVAGLDAKVIRRAYSLSEYDIVKELFELQKSTSDLNKSTKEGLDDICRSNVKMVLVGSTDDSFIPLHSSISHQSSHPNIFKSTYCDENTEIPKFIRDLFTIVLTMENVGLVDSFQLLKDISELSQGFISSCTHRMEIYKSSDVYDMGVQFATETTSLKLHKDVAFSQPATNGSETERNLYHLPWNVRGLIDTLLNIKHVRSVKLLKDLVVDYQNWQPTTRLGQEVKQCFAAFEDANPEDLLL